MNAVEHFRQLRPSFSLAQDGPIGAVDSQHQVFFGRINALPVAVKPYAQKERAYHEADMLKLTSGLGILSVRPHCVLECPVGSNGAFLVTERIPRLESAASLAYNGDPQKIAHNEGLVTDVSKVLARMHGAGITHGDSQVKNFGFIGRTGPTDIIVYDLEKGGSSTIGHIKNDPFSHDLDSLAQSLAYKGLGGANIDAAAQTLERVVLEPYQEQARASGLDDRIAQDAIESAYTKFVDKHEDISFRQANGGHDSRRHVA